MEQIDSVEDGDHICIDKNNNFYQVNNITVVLTNVLAPWAPLGSRLWDLKTIPLHIHFPNEVFHLLLILPILYNAHCALDRNADLHVSAGNNNDLANPLDSVCAPSCCILHGDNFSTFC